MLDTDVKVKDVRVDFRKVKFRFPLVFSGNPVKTMTLAEVEVDVENRKGNNGTGRGLSPFGVLWAFGDDTRDITKEDICMRELCKKWAKVLKVYPDYAHPLDIYWDTRKQLGAVVDGVTNKFLGRPMPVLAQLVAVSGIDAAIHDAFGKCNGMCTYAGYSKKFCNYDLMRYLGPDFKGHYLGEYLRPVPHIHLPVFHLVGCDDWLLSDDVPNGKDPNDGLPVSLDKWIRQDGICCFKIKVGTMAPEEAAERTVRVYNIARKVIDQIGMRVPIRLSVDPNEKYTPDQVDQFLTSTNNRSNEAFSCLIYLEQPTSRDISEVDLHSVAARKLVFADEGITDLESIDTAIKKGWSGIALKTVKGFSFSTLAVAKATERRVCYTIQDLTNPGVAFIHSAGLAARTNPVLGLEYNARQFIPHASIKDAAIYPDLFTVKHGCVNTASLKCVGLE